MADLVMTLWCLWCFGLLAFSGIGIGVVLLRLRSENLGLVVLLPVLQEPSFHVGRQLLAVVSPSL